MGCLGCGRRCRGFVGGVTGGPGAGAPGLQAQLPEGECAGGGQAQREQVGGVDACQACTPKAQALCGAVVLQALVVGVGQDEPAEHKEESHRGAACGQPEAQKCAVGAGAVCGAQGTDRGEVASSSPIRRQRTVWR